MARERQVTVRFLGDEKDLLRSFKNVEGGTQGVESRLTGVGDKFKSVGDKMQNVGLKMSAAMTLPILAVGKVAFNAASDLNESLSKVNVVFGQSGREIDAWAKTAAKSMGQSRQQALEAAGTFGNLFVALKIGPRAATDMSKKMVELASDLASFNNVSPDEALLALRSGLVGETEPLRKFGVNLNDATLRAKALELGLIKNTKDALDPAAKAQAAYAIILDQTKTAQGDFARTADGAANKQRILAAQFKDTAASVGNALLPIGQKLLGFLGGLAEKFNALSPQTQQMILVVAGLAAALGPVVALVGTLATVIGFLISPVGLVIVGIAALAAGLIYAYTHFEGFRNVVDAVAGALLAAFTWVQGNWPLLLAILTGPFGLAAKFIIENFDGIVSFVKGIPGRITGALAGMWDGLVSGFKAAINTILRAWNGLEFKIPGFHQSVFGKEIGFGGVTLGVPDIPLLAKGGIVSRPTLAVLGEAGPEAVVPLNRFSAPMGVRDIHVHLTANGPVVGNGMRELAAQITSEIRKQLRRDGRDTIRTTR